MASGSGQQPALVAHEFEPGPFATDRRRVAVPGEDPDGVLEIEQSAERGDHRDGVATGQVDPAPARRRTACRR